MPMGRIEGGERTDTNDNGGGKIREYRCPARHRIIPYTSIPLPFDGFDANAYVRPS